MYNLNRRTYLKRTRPSVRFWALAAGIATSVMGWAAPLPFVSEGTEYSPAGSSQGDQMSPALALRSTGGCLVWQDNLTDGDGLGISARRLSSQLTGLSSLRVNENGTADQENPQVAILPDGSNLIVWQSGKRDSQSIVGRILKADGKFLGPEFAISANGKDNRDAVLAVSRDGSVLVVWAAEGVDDSMFAVQAQRLSSTGEKLGAAITVNQYTRFHQRNPAVAALATGGFVITWISEHQRFENSVDVYAREFNELGESTVDEFLVNTSARPCTTPSVAGLPNGGFVAAWAEHQKGIPGAVWDIYSRVFTSTGPVGAANRVNTRQDGFQVMPKLAVTSDSLLVIYRSQGGDANGLGVVGQWLSLDGSLLGDELVVNTRTRGDQLTPTVGTDGSGRVVVVWSTFGGINRGMDLAAQRFNRRQTPLGAPGTPYVLALSASKLLVTWPEASGLPVGHYELYLDGAELPLVSSKASYVVGGLVPASTHALRIAYVLSDGRKSPLSEAVSGTTWGEDDNADGLPDDWQALFFGNNPDAWPSPAFDSDGDGVNNRNEFLAGTDPTSSQSVLLTSLVATPQGPILVWNSQAGAIYQVQSSVNLKTWTDVGGPRLAAGSSDSIPAGETPANAYYRVNLLR